MEKTDLNLGAAQHNWVLNGKCRKNKKKRERKQKKHIDYNNNDS